MNVLLEDRTLIITFPKDVNSEIINEVVDFVQQKVNPQSKKSFIDFMRNNAVQGKGFTFDREATHER